MSWPSPADLESLVTRFVGRTLPKSEWTHAAHLAVGTWHVNADGPERALSTLRSGIRLLNDAHGTANTDTSGYHESITQAYVMLIAEFLKRTPASREEDLAMVIQQLLASPLARRDALLICYTKERLFSVEARRGWVAPDRCALSLGAVFEDAAASTRS